MRREDGLSIISLVIIVVVLVIIAVIAFNKMFGEQGVVSQYTESDVEYNKTEMVEKLNLIVKEKYVLDYNMLLKITKI